MITVSMNTFLELKIENERLTQQLKERRLLLAQATSGSNPTTLSIPSGQMHGYSSTAYGIPGARTENGSSSNTHRMNSTFVQSTYGQMYEDNTVDDGGIKKKVRYHNLFNVDSSLNDLCNLLSARPVQESGGERATAHMCHLWADELARMAQRTHGSENALQCMWPSMGQTCKENG